MSDLKKVMICDDTQDNRDIFSRHLEMEGYEVVLVSSGKECLKALNEGNVPDLLLLDVMMPEISGLQVLAEIRKANLKLFPIVMLTAVGEREVVKKAVLLGANDYMIKPVSKTTLVERVTSHLERLTDAVAIELIGKANIADDKRLPTVLQKMVEANGRKTYPMKTESHELIILIKTGKSPASIAREAIPKVKESCLIFARKGYLFSVIWPRDVECDPTLGLTSLQAVNTSFLAENDPLLAS